ncbi:MAG: hypothetical protein ABSG86_23405 [Thermoguttaceae bacterium]
MNAGESFFFEFSEHLWIVISDPSLDGSHVLVANVSTDRGHDPACILQPGDHPFVKHRSCIRYDKCCLWRNADLERLVSSGRIRPQEPISAELLARVREGAGNSDFIALGCRQLLAEQGLIDA